MQKKTVVIGASTNEERYANRFIKLLNAKNIPCIGLGLKEGIIGQTKIIVNHEFIPQVHTVSIYLRADIKKTVYNYILSLKPKRIIFNPGAENIILTTIAKDNGIETTNACSIVLLSTGQY